MFQMKYLNLVFQGFLDHRNMNIGGFFMELAITNTNIKVDLELINVGQINITSPRSEWITSVSRMVEGYLRGVSLEGGGRPSFSVILPSTNILVLQGNTLQITSALHELAMINDDQRDMLFSDIGREVLQKVCRELSRESREAFTETVKRITEVSASPTV